MPQLTWIGKDKVKNHHHDVPFHLLEKQYDFKADNDKPKNSQNNMLIQGDNLLALKSLLPKYEGKINCIYIDPPYNTGNEKWVYNDNVNDPRIKKWLGEVVGKEGEDLSRHDKWLCMMYPRLKLLHRLLASDGVIFISIDDNEIASLKLICDEIFGYSNNIGIYSWYRSATPANLSKKIKKNLEYVLCYQRGRIESKFKGVIHKNRSSNGLLNQSNNVGILKFPPNVINTNIKDGVIHKGIYGTEHYDVELLEDTEVRNKKFIKEVTLKAKFKWTQSYLDNELKKGTKINIPTLRFSPSYEKLEYDADIPSNFINEKVGVDTTENAGTELNSMFKESVFDYPKPPSLISYLIDFLDNPNAIVLDSFMGSGTTAHAVLNLNAKDGGNRQFIGIEMMDYAENITAERIRRVINGYGSKPETQKGTGGGFSFYTIGETLFDSDGNLNNQADLISIREYIAHSEKLETVFDNHTSGYFLGSNYQTAYIFYYEADQVTTLSLDFLRSLNADFMAEKPKDFIIYADKCTLTDEQLAQFKIRFKRIPRDISKL